MSDEVVEVKKERRVVTEVDEDVVSELGSVVKDEEIVELALTHIGLNPQKWLVSRQQRGSGQE